MLLFVVAVGIFGAKEDADPEVAAASTEQPTVAPTPVERSARDTTREMLDAAQRAQAWHQDAVLAEIQVKILEEGRHGPKRQGPLEIHYGQPRKGFGPGAPLTAERLVLTYDGEESQAEQRTTQVSGSHIGLPDPNCPLEVAWLKATQAGLSRDQVVQLKYTLHEGLKKPVWRASNSDSTATYTLDGHTCAIQAR